MGNDLTAVPGVLTGMAAAATSAGEMITTAGSADAAGSVASVAAAVGPIGAMYLAAFAPAQANNLAATMLLGAVHAGIGGATQAANAGYQAVDAAL